jgi:hypothetical protein
MKKLAMGAMVAGLVLAAAGSAAEIEYWVGPDRDGSGQGTGQSGLGHVINSHILGLPYAQDGAGYAVEADDQYDPDDIWYPGDEASAELVFEFAGYRDGNSFGMYTDDGAGGAELYEIFTGTDDLEDEAVVSFGATQTTVEVTHDGVTSTKTHNVGLGDGFGFYLDVGVTGQTFYSEQSRNVDGADHMVAFDLSSFAGHEKEFVLGWEDLAFPNTDKDYNDMILTVSNVHTVPEPATYALLGIGLACMAGFVALRRKRVPVKND